jgi:AcrR family transcriptional regulator
MARYQAGLRTEARITESTRELLGEVGLEATTLKAICDRAGVRAGSFYNLFDSKEEVVLRVVGEAIVAVDPDPDGRNTDTVEDLVEAYIRFIEDQSTLAKIYLQIAVSGAIKNGQLGVRVFRHHALRTTRFTEALVRQRPDLDREEAEARTEVLLATLNGLAFRWMLDPAFDFAAHARRAAFSPTIAPCA